MKKKMKWTALAMAAAMGLMAGSAMTVAAEDDPNEEVDLVMYLLGPRPARFDNALEKFNEMALEELNCTLTVNFIEYGDLQTKYPLIFSSGEEFDLAYAGTWVNFANLAQKGAFTPLEDLLLEYCADSLKLQPEDSLEQATINGHIYAYPTNYYTYSAYGVAVRGDIMEKYGFSELKDFDDLMAFLEAAVPNEPQFTNPMGIGNNEVFSDIYMESTGLYPINGGQYGIYYIDSSSGEPKVIAEHEWEGYTDFCKKAKEWSDLGFWPKSALSVTDTASDLVKSGTAIVGFTNFDAGMEVYQACDKEWDIRWDNLQPHVNHLAYTQDCMVVPSSSKHPERALKLLDKLKTDERYYDLLTYGIEGEDFIREDGNRFTMVDPDLFLSEPGTWGFRSQQFCLVGSANPENYTEMKQALEDAVEPNIFRNFNMDTEPVKTEYAAMQNVYSQYNSPLELGMTSDVEKDVEQLKEKADAAGNEKIKEELQKQVDEFYAANKDKE